VIKLSTARYLTQLSFLPSTYRERASRYWLRFLTIGAGASRLCSRRSHRFDLVFPSHYGAPESIEEDWRRVDSDSLDETVLDAAYKAFKMRLSFFVRRAGIEKR
jgi:hypothetical protein